MERYKQKLKEIVEILLNKEDNYGEIKRAQQKFLKWTNTYFICWDSPFCCINDSFDHCFYKSGSKVYLK